MAKEKKEKTNAAEKQAPVLPHPKAASDNKCKFEDCKKGNQKFGFCAEHYEWYMEGLIRGDGRKPVDFQEKFALWQRKKAASKAA